jgi:hypothetical protein
VVGPYGSFFNSSLGVRLAYWIVAMWVGVPVFGLGVRLALAAGRRVGAPPWFAAAIAGLLGSAVLAAIVSRIAVALWPHLARFTPLIWYGQCLAITIPLVGAYVILRPRLLRPVELEPSTLAERSAEPPIEAEGRRALPAHGGPLCAGPHPERLAPGRRSVRASDRRHDPRGHARAPLVVGGADGRDRGRRRRPKSAPDPEGRPRRAGLSRLGGEAPGSGMAGAGAPLEK